MELLANDDADGKEHFTRFCIFPHHTTNRTTTGKTVEKHQRTVENNEKALEASGERGKMQRNKLCTIPLSAVRDFTRTPSTIVSASGLFPSRSVLSACTW